VASEPLDEDPCWTAVAPGSVVTADLDAVRVDPLSHPGGLP